MDQNQPIEVMIRDIEEVQMFLLARPDGDQELTNPTMIQYVLTAFTPKRSNVGEGRRPPIKNYGPRSANTRLANTNSSSTRAAAPRYPKKDMARITWPIGNAKNGSYPRASCSTPNVQSLPK